MNTTTRVGGFGVGVAAAAAVAALIGSAVGPVGAAPERHAGGHNVGKPATGDGFGGEHSAHADVGVEPAMAPPQLPGGLVVSQDRLSLQLLEDRFRAGARTTLRLRIVDETGDAVTDFENTHGKDLHLIVVRRDLSGFQHVHPVMDTTGTWSATLALEAGDHRVFADFKPEGAATGYTLGHDVSVAGRYEPQPLPAPSSTGVAGPYEVRLDGDLVPGETSRLTLSVSRGGAPVTDLQPYLGAYGHLVALREGDLAYLHVHPAGEPGDGRARSGPEIPFYVEVPSTGTYRLVLGFRHRGRVRNAAVTATSGRAPAHEDSH